MKNSTKFLIGLIIILIGMFICYLPWFFISVLIVWQVVSLFVGFAISEDIFEKKYSQIFPIWLYSPSSWIAIYVILLLFPVVALVIERLSEEDWVYEDRYLTWLKWSPTYWLFKWFSQFLNWLDK